MRILSCLLFLATAAPASAQPRALLTADDYPIEAWKKGEQGIVRARLVIGTNGRVTACSIIQSASPSLDAATCRVLTERALFTPAKDEQGNPQVDTYDTPPIRWVIPGGKPPKRDRRDARGLRLEN